MPRNGKVNRTRSPCCSAERPASKTFESGLRAAFFAPTRLRAYAPTRLPVSPSPRLPACRLPAYPSLPRKREPSDPRPQQTDQASSALAPGISPGGAAAASDVRHWVPAFAGTTAKKNAARGGRRFISRGSCLYRAGPAFVGPAFAGPAFVGPALACFRETRLLTCCPSATSARRSRGGRRRRRPVRGLRCPCRWA